MNNLLLIFLGGGLGSVVRYGISTVVRNNFKTAFPLATLCSNVLSCLILALAVVLLSGKLNVNPSLRFFLIIGFCGGFSTFSAFSYETIELMRSGNVTFAILNVFISIAVCFSLIYFITKTN
ncbi:MAG: fluoride efflux transporter CrcB [Bacteroidota bacterium]|nr:fluoride efflux transporter CrcB [Bacteroidota bacterium]